MNKKKIQSEEEPLLMQEDPTKSLKNPFKRQGPSQPSNLNPASGAQSTMLPPKPPRPQKQPTRTTKISQKLVVFPESNQPDTQVTDLASEYGDADERIVSYPLQVAKEREAERLSRMDRQDLPRVTAYCTAKDYHMDALYTFLLSKADSNGCDPKRIDECIYTKYIPPMSIFQFGHPGSRSQSRAQTAKPRATTPSGVPLQASRSPGRLSENTYPSEFPSDFSPKQNYSDFVEDEKVPIDEYPGNEKQSAGLGIVLIKVPDYGEIYLFDYGVVVMWGLTEPQEQYFLSILKPFEDDKLSPEDIETEPFHYQYRPFSQPRIFNDVITLRAPSGSSSNVADDLQGQKHDSMIKLTISHSIAQSTKLALFENRIDDTITTTQHIPVEMAKTGKVPMSRAAIIKKIGQLFVMRINVNLVSPILDTPEIFWSEPSLEPLYTAVRGYLEISQRVELLNQRCNVISDLLDMLKEHLNSAHGETLEWIIIILIAIEILIGLVEIFFDFINLYKPH